MIRKGIKKTCPKCGKEHYDNRSCIKKEKNDNNNIYKLIQEKKVYD